MIFGEESGHDLGDLRSRSDRISGEEAAACSYSPAGAGFIPMNDQCFHQEILPLSLDSNRTKEGLKKAASL